MKPKSMLMALWMPIFCAACGQTDLERVQSAGGAIGLARADRVLPDLPSDCRLFARGGVREGDRLDVALLKVDSALSRQNARTARCADWYDQIQAGIAP